MLNRKVILTLFVLSFKASASIAIETISPEVCLEAQTEYREVITRLDQKFKSAAHELGLNQSFFYPENALIGGSIHGCKLVKNIHTKRASSPRPQLRPSDFKPNPETETAETNFEKLLREVMQVEKFEASKPATNYGVPLTGGEREKFRKQVEACWTVDAKSPAANVVVTIAMEMQPSGKVISSSMELIAFSGGNQSAANVAFQRGRRAILRCQKDGYELPEHKYDHWRNIEITFDPVALRKR